MNNIGKVKTGELMFAFDDEEPQLLTEVFDCDPCEFILKQNSNGARSTTSKDDTEIQRKPDKPSLEFRKGSKKFRIFIRDTRLSVVPKDVKEEKGQQS